MATFADFGPDDREVPRVNPVLCHPRLALKPHSHVVCEAWLDGSLAAPVLRDIERDIIRGYVARAREDIQRRIRRREEGL